MNVVLGLNYSFSMVLTSIQSTALRNHMRIVFKDMSSWTPLTISRDEDFKHFKQKICKAKMSGFLL